MATSIGERIKIARRNAGVTQQALANYVGVSRSAVAQWENGETKGLKPENLVLTAEGLNVSIKWLAMGKGPMHGTKEGGEATELPFHVLQLARLIAQAPPEKVQAILLLLGASEEDICRLSHRNATPNTIQEGVVPEIGERRSGKDRRQNVEKVDFDRRSGRDRRASQPFFDDPEMQKKYGRPRRKTNKHKRRKDESDPN